MRTFEQGDVSMRYLPKILGAALLLSAGLLVGSGPAAATMPGLLDRSAVTDSALEKVGYYYRRRYYRPYAYGYRSYRPHYGYGYRRRGHSPTHRRRTVNPIRQRRERWPVSPPTIAG